MKTPATASLDEAVETTAGAVDRLAKAGKAQKLLLTMLHLRSASQQPGPFVAELAAARAAVGDDDAGARGGVEDAVGIRPDRGGDDAGVA